MAWILPPPQRCSAQPRVQLVCIPGAGFGAQLFHGAFAEALQPAVGLLPIELPGRNTRRKEPFRTELLPLAQELADVLASSLGGEQPIAVFGHSMGAWLAYETCLALASAGRPPVKLYVSGMRSPTLFSQANEVDPPGLASLPEPAFWTRFERRYGANPDLQRPAIKSFLFPLMQADLLLSETYPGRAAGDAAAQVSCPLAAIGVRGDPRYRTEQLSEWRAVAGVSFSEIWFDAPATAPAWSNAHRYLVDDPSSMLNWLKADLLATLEKPTLEHHCTAGS